MIRFTPCKARTGPLGDVSGLASRKRSQKPFTRRPKLGIFHPLGIAASPVNGVRVEQGVRSLTIITLFLTGDGDKKPAETVRVMEMVTRVPDISFSPTLLPGYRERIPSSSRGGRRRRWEDVIRSHCRAELKIKRPKVNPSLAAGNMPLGFRQARVLTAGPAAM